MKRNFILLILLLIPSFFFSQSLTAIDDYLKIDAVAKDPIYTTYTASLSRTMLPEAMAYKLDYYTDTCLINYSGNRSGRIMSFWKIDEVLIQKTSDYFKKPVLKYSFPDMVVMEYQPVSGILVTETFLVYSSSLAVVDIEVSNTDAKSHEVSLFPVLCFYHDSVQIDEYNREYAGILATRIISDKRMMNNIRMESSRPTRITEFFTASPKILSYEYHHFTMEEFKKSLITILSHDEKHGSQNLPKNSFANLLVLHQKKLVRPHETISFRYIRGTQLEQEDHTPMMKEAANLKSCFLKTFFDDNLMLFVNIPKIQFDQREDKLVYISALNLARGSIYPAYGKSRYNFFSSSKDNVPDTNQEQQLMRDAPGLMGYVYVDPKSAENAHRVLIEQLDQNSKPGSHRSNYATVEDSLKTCLQVELPFFCWIAAEIYKVSRDKQFLREAYYSGVKYVDRLIEEYLSEKRKNLDLTVLITQEERYLAWMAKEIGRIASTSEWLKKASVTARVVEDRMWDDSTGFYYSLDQKEDESATGVNVRKRKEISGFLPLSAGIASKEHAEKLLQTLTDSSQFYRKYGIPDIPPKEYTNPGAKDHSNNRQPCVRLLMNYMVYIGLLRYGYHDIAKELGAKMKLCVSTQLSKNHDFWECYSPDAETANGITNYFPDSIIAKLLIEENVK